MMGSMLKSQQSALRKKEIPASEGESEAGMGECLNLFGERSLPFGGEGFGLGGTGEVPLESSNQQECLSVGCRGPSGGRKLASVGHFVVVFRGGTRRRKIIMQ